MQVPCQGRNYDFFILFFMLLLIFHELVSAFGSRRILDASGKRVDQAVAGDDFPAR